MSSMPRIIMLHRTPSISSGAAFLVATLLAHHAAAEEPAKEASVTLTFPAPTRARATLTVNADDPGGPTATFNVRVGSAVQTFTRATPRASRTIAVPADPRTFLRFSVEQTGAPAVEALALITPDSRPLLVPDACATWALATTGGSASTICVARERHCPTASRPSADRGLTETQCGSGTVKFCVPDYRIDVAGENRQKVRVGVEGDPGQWIPLRGPDKIRHLSLPSGGRCPGVTVESGSERVRISLGWGQRVLVRVSSSGQLSAEYLAPPAAEAGGSAGGD
jgi:hypothetical protein